jgi:putative ABC transport system ATP-binding protein
MLDPPLLLADEPSGNLDSAAGAVVLELLQQIHLDGKTVVVVTHEASVAAAADRVLEMHDGRVSGAAAEASPA